MRTRRCGARTTVLVAATLVVAAMQAPADAAAAGPAVTITEYSVPTPDSAPFGITAGPDGALWFTEQVSHKIGRITTAGSITEYDVPVVNGTHPQVITTGPDGALWFGSTEHISRIAANGEVTSYAIDPASLPTSITTGPDGALWFTASGKDNIAYVGRITTSGVFTRVYRPGEVHYGGLTVGPDGALWFTAVSESTTIRRLTTAGVVTTYRAPSADGMTLGPDGALWFTDFAESKIVRMTTAAQITEFPLPTAGAGPLNITTGPDGALWFTELKAGKIGRITTDGTITEYALPSSPQCPNGRQPWAIAAGADGALWFTECWNKIGRIAPTASAPTPALTASASVNQPTFTSGQTVSATAGLTNPGLPASADIYVGVLLPDGTTLVFLTGTGFATGTITDLTSFHPIATGVSLAAPFSVTVPNFFSYTWTGAEPHGTYVFFVVALKPGALANGVVSDDEILGLATAVFTFQ